MPTWKVIIVLHQLVALEEWSENITLADIWLLLAAVEKVPQEKDKLGKVSAGLHIRMEEKRQNSGGWKLKEGSHSAPWG